MKQYCSLLRGRERARERGSDSFLFQRFFELVSSPESAISLFPKALTMMEVITHGSRISSLSLLSDLPGLESLPTTHPALHKLDSLPSLIDLIHSHTTTRQAAGQLSSYPVHSRSIA